MDVQSGDTPLTEGCTRTRDDQGIVSRVGLASVFHIGLNFLHPSSALRLVSLDRIVGAGEQNRTRRPTKSFGGSRTFSTTASESGTGCITTGVGTRVAQRTNKMAVSPNNELIVGGSDTKNSRAAARDNPGALRGQSVADDNPGGTTCNRTQLAPAASLHPESPAAISLNLIADLLDEPWDYVPTHQRDREWYTLL